MSSRAAWPQAAACLLLLGLLYLFESLPPSISCWGHTLLSLNFFAAPALVPSSLCFESLFRTNRNVFPPACVYIAVFLPSIWVACDLCRGCDNIRVNQLLNTPIHPHTVTSAPMRSAVVRASLALAALMCLSSTSFAQVSCCCSLACLCIACLQGACSLGSARFSSRAAFS